MYIPKSATKLIDREEFEKQLGLYMNGRVSATRAAKALSINPKTFKNRLYQYLEPEKYGVDLDTIFTKKTMNVKTEKKNIKNKVKNTEKKEEKRITLPDLSSFI